MIQHTTFNACTQDGAKEVSGNFWKSQGILESKISRHPESRKSRWYSNSNDIMRKYNFQV